MSKANRKFQEADLFGRKYKMKATPLSRIKRIEKDMKEEKRRIRRAINKMKHKVEE